MAQGPTDSPDDDRTAALVATLVQQNAEILAEIKRLLARVAELEAKLGQPPKTPDNSSLPPSRRQKANAEPPPAGKLRDAVSTAATSCSCS
jgi:transposase